MLSIIRDTIHCSWTTTLHQLTTRLTDFSQKIFTLLAIYKVFEILKLLRHSVPLFIHSVFYKGNYRYRKGSVIILVMGALPKNLLIYDLSAL